MCDVLHHCSRMRPTNLAGNTPANCAPHLTCSLLSTSQAQPARHLHPISHATPHSGCSSGRGEGALNVCGARAFGVVRSAARPALLRARHTPPARFVQPLLRPCACMPLAAAHQVQPSVQPHLPDVTRLGGRPAGTFMNVPAPGGAGRKRGGAPPEPGDVREVRGLQAALKSSAVWPLRSRCVVCCSLGVQAARVWLAGS